LSIATHLYPHAHDLCKSLEKKKDKYLRGKLQSNEMIFQLKEEEK